MPQRISTSKWCHLRSSQNLRSAVRVRMKHYNVAQVCRDMELPEQKIWHWLNGHDKKINQWELIQFCKRIGIQIELKICLE